MNTKELGKTLFLKLFPTLTENPIYVFPEMKLRDLVSNSYIYVSLRDLYILRIGLPIWLQKNRQTDHPGNISIAHIYMIVKIGRLNIIILFSNNNTSQFHFSGYINWNQTFLYWIFTGASFAN